MRCPDCGHDNIAGEETCQECSAPLSSLALPQAKADSVAQLKILEGTISQLGPHPAATVSPEDSVADAVRLMRRQRMGCVLAMEGSALRGILTERDILYGVAGLKDPSRVRVAEVMKGDVQFLAEEEPVAHAFHNMAVHGHRHIPVRRADGSLGIISSRDLLRYLCQ